MDGQLRDVVRQLQAGPFVADTLEQVRRTLNELRSTGRAAEVEAQRADMVVLLDDFAEQARTPTDAAAAHLLAADLCQMGGAPEHTVERLALALDLDPTNNNAAQLLERVLSAPKDRSRLLALLSARAQALVTSDYVDDAHASSALVQIGAIHAQARDWDKAIDVYDRALELSPDVQVVETLAGLYERRHKPGDAEQAADLLCALYDVLPPEEGLHHVQHALRLVPGHAEARQRLQSARPVGNHGETKVGPAPQAPQAQVPAPQPAVAPSPAGPSLISVAPPKAAGATSRPARKARKPAPTPVALPDPSPALPSSVAPASTVAPQPSVSSPSFDSQAKTLQMQPSLVAQAQSFSPAMAGAAAGASSVPPPAALAPEATAGLGSGDMFSVVSASLASGRPPPEVTAEAALHQAQESKQKKMMAAIVAAVTLLAGVGAYALLNPSEEPEPDTDVAAAVAPEEGTPESAKEPEAPLPEASAAAAPQEAEDEPKTEAAQANAAGTTAEPSAEAAVATNTAVTANAAVPTMEPSTPASSPRRRRAQPEVSVLKGGAKIRGAKVDKKGFMAAMERRLPRVERCYKQALRRDKKLQGRLVYGFKVRRNGRPMKVDRIGGTIDDKRLDRCTRKALSGTRFPRWKKGATARVRLPLKFDK